VFGIILIRNSGGTKCQEIGVMPRSSAAGIVNFQEFLYLKSFLKVVFNDYFNSSFTLFIRVL
jgi:hypothetical protein